MSVLTRRSTAIAFGILVFVVLGVIFGDNLAIGLGLGIALAVYLTLIRKLRG